MDSLYSSRIEGSEIYALPLTVFLNAAFGSCCPNTIEGVSRLIPHCLFKTVTGQAGKTNLPCNSYYPMAFYPLLWRFPSFSSACLFIPSLAHIFTHDFTFGQKGLLGRYIYSALRVTILYSLSQSIKLSRY